MITVSYIFPYLLVVYFLHIFTFNYIQIYQHYSILALFLTDIGCFAFEWIMLGCLSLSYYSGSKIFYSFFTFFVGVIYGYQLQVFMGILFAIPLQILSFIVYVPSSVIEFCFYYLPIFLFIKGVITAHIINIERISLKYEGFKSSTTICHVSDLHLGAMLKKGFVDRLVRKIAEVKADVVVITGDLADGAETVESEWLTSFKTLSMPVLFVTGNHEETHGRTEILSILEPNNIKHIGNEIYKCKGINFVGVDYHYELKDKLREFKKKLLSPENKDVPAVLLNHVPQLAPKELEEFDIFLFLSGHTHAGQVFPMHIPAYFLNACFAGLYNYKNKHYHYVSPGVGYANVPLRTFCTCAITEFTIHG